MKHPTMNRTRWQVPWLSRLICVSAALLFFVLSAQAEVNIVEGGISEVVVIPYGEAYAPRPSPGKSHMATPTA